MIQLTVNGETHELDIDPTTPLLYVLQDELGLNGAKFGCGLGQCGACIVVADGQPVISCVVPASVMEGRSITTLEGLGTLDAPGPLQRAFIEEEAAQCGFCIPGMMMQAHALLLANAAPTDDEIRAHMQPMLCRCGTHMRILRAIRRAADAGDVVAEAAL